MKYKYEILGLAFSGHWLVYRGWVRGRKIKRLVPAGMFVRLWNRTVCAIEGHDRTLEPVVEIRNADGTFSCCMCCARLNIS